MQPTSQQDPKPRKPRCAWDESQRMLLVKQIFGEEIWSWSHGTVTKKWDDIAQALSAMPEFQMCNGVKASSCKEKWNAITSQVSQETGFGTGDDRQSGRAHDYTEFEKIVLDCLEKCETAAEEREIVKQGTTRLQSELNAVEGEVLTPNAKRRKGSSPGSGDSSNGSLESSLALALESVSNDGNDREVQLRRLKLDENRLQMEFVKMNWDMADVKEKRAHDLRMKELEMQAQQQLSAQLYKQQQDFMTAVLSTLKPQPPSSPN